MTEQEILNGIGLLASKFEDDVSETIRETAMLNYKLYKNIGQGYAITQKIEETEDGYRQVLSIDGISDKERILLEKSRERYLKEIGWSED